MPPVLIAVLVLATLCAVVTVIYACLYYTRINPRAAAARSRLHGYRKQSYHVAVTSAVGGATANTAGSDEDQAPVVTSQLPMTATHMFLFRKVT